MRVCGVVQISGGVASGRRTASQVTKARLASSFLEAVELLSLGLSGREQMTARWRQLQAGKQAGATVSSACVKREQAREWRCARRQQGMGD